MAVIQVAFLFSAILVSSNGFYLPPNDGTEIGEHFLNQKLTFLEGKFKNSPLVDFDLIKQKIEAKRLAEKEAETIGETDENNPEVQDLKLWFLQNKFGGPKFDFIKQKIESKQSENSDLDIFNQKVAFLENFLNQHINKEQPNHEISKRSTKEETNPGGAAIGNYFLNQKLSFLENKFKDSPLVDFDLIKQKIEAKQAAKEQEQEENKLVNHQIGKRSVDETNVKDPSIGKYFLNQKLSFLENKFKDSPLVDFDLIKQKIEAKQAAKEQENKLTNHQISKRSDEETNVKDPSIGKYFLNQKLSFLENKFKNSPLVDFDLIKQKIEAKQAAKEQENQLTNHQVAKRSVDETNVKDPSIGKYFLNQKLTFLENKFKDSPLVDFDLIKQKIEAKQAAKEQENVQEENKLTNLLNYLKQIHAEKLSENHQITKRSVDETNVKDPSIGNYFLNQKLSFMENKFKGTAIDFEMIKNKIEAKKEAKLQEELETAQNDDKNLQEKITFLQNFLKEMKADQLKAIIDKIEGTHNVAKRSVKNENENGGAEYGAAMKDHFLKQKYAFLSNKFNQMNMDSEGLLQKIQSKQKGGQ